jgi:hypothetical protein
VPVKAVPVKAVPAKTKELNRCVTEAPENEQPIKIQNV